MKKIVISIIIILCAVIIHAQPITVSGAIGQSPDAFLNNNFAGEGVTLYNCKFNHNSSSINSTSVGTFSNTNTSFPFPSGILLTTGNIDVAPGPNNTGSKSNTTGVINANPMDQNLADIATNTLGSNSFLEFTFNSGRNEFSNVVSFNYIFGSEEYLEYVCESYNDIFAFWLFGPGLNNCGNYQPTALPNNIAFIPGHLDVPVCIDRVHNLTNMTGSCLPYPDFYKDNDNGTAIQYDGYTARREYPGGPYIGMTASASLCPCQEYKMRISIANVGDQAWDSGVFLEQGSFKMPKGLTISDSITSNRDTIIKNCTESNIQIHYGEPLESGMNIILYSDGGTANQEDFYLIRYRTSSLIDTVHHGDTIYFSEGDTLIDMILKATEDAQFAPNEEVKTIQLIFKSILCTEFKYLDGRVEERSQYDTINYVMIDNNHFTLVSEDSNEDTIYYCDRCTHVEVPITGGTEPLKYDWSPANMLNSPHSHESNCNLTETTTFQIIVSDRWGCLVDTCYHTIYVTNTPELNGHFQITPNVICVPEEVEFKSNATPANTHQWIISSNNMTDTIYGANQTYTFTDPGHYSIFYTAYEAKECAASINLPNYINAGLQPTASFFFDPVEAEVGDTVFFTNESTGMDVHYNWGFGDGGNSTEEDPIHIYYSENIYNVLLTVSDDAGCEDTYTLPVPVVDNHVLFVPNSFTPNKDGLNDVFLPTVACVDPKRYYLVIYDRSGSIVFSTHKTSESWDGTIDGKECPSGVYTYFISYYRYNNLKQELIKTGNINLIR